MHFTERDYNRLHTFLKHMRAQWIQNGYVILRNAIDVKRAQQDMSDMFPRETPHPVQDFGNAGEGEFPSRPSLNDIAVHPVLLKTARELLQTNDILLTQSVAWAKYGQPAQNTQSNQDQRVHMDYGNNYWTVPPDTPDMVAAIVYLSNTATTGGGTAVVPQQSPRDPIYQRPLSHMPGLCGKPFINLRGPAEHMMQQEYPESASVRAKCYEREVKPDYKAGDVLLYKMTTWHRGTPVKPGEVRYVQNLAWRRKDAEGIQQWNPAFTKKLYSGDLETYIGTLEPEQLETLGFPARDSKKWLSKQFCKAVRGRYEWAGFDIGKYVRTPAEPPTMPVVWQWTGVTFDGTCPQTLRKTLFKHLDTLGVFIELKSADWKYRLHYCQGPLYMKADCVFFKTGVSSYKMEIQHLSGDRWAWWKIMHNLQALQAGKTPELIPEFTPIVETFKPILEQALHEDIESIAMVGQDSSPDVLVPLLSSLTPDVVYAAMFRMALFNEAPKDLTTIRKWAQRPCHGYLQRRISDCAARILQKTSRL